MATVQRRGYVFMELDSDWAHDDYETKWRPIWREYKASETDTRVYIGERGVTFEVPDDFDPRGKQIAFLEAQRTDLMAKYQAAVTEINARISNLQAIEYTAEPA